MFLARSELIGNDIKPQVNVVGDVVDVTIEISAAIAVAIKMLDLDENGVEAMLESIKNSLDEMLPQINEDNPLTPNHEEFLGDFTNFTEEDYEKFKKNILTIKPEMVSSYCPYPLMVHYGRYTFDIVVKYQDTKINLSVRIYKNYGTDEQEFIGSTRILNDWTPDIPYKTMQRLVNVYAVSPIAQLFDKE